jgi:WD40 repeat protein
MPDLKTRFRGAERITAPDLWPDITSREPRRPAPEPSLARRSLVATLALALAVAGIALVVRAFEGPRERSQPITPAPGSINGVIAYASIGEQQVFWTIRPDGSDPTRVHVDVPGFVRVPSWSLGGRRIVFDVNSFDDRHPEGGNFDIYVSNADGTNPIRLTAERVDHSPVWSPDGTQIAYVHGWDEQAQIWVMNANGSGSHQVTDRRGPNLFPSWSPDGTKIAFVSFDGSNADIYLMSADGSSVKRLTDDPAHEDQPAWSPDGHQIAFSSEGGGNPGIYLMSPDGTGVTQLLEDPDPANLGFAWSPDGAKMAVVSIRGPGNDRNVYVLDVATGELTAIGQPGAFYGPSWQPLPVDGARPTGEPSPSVFETQPIETHVTAMIPVGAFLRGVAVGEGRVWASVDNADGGSNDHLLVGIDPATNKVVSSVALPEAGDLAVGDGSVWVLSRTASEGAILRIEPSTNGIDATIPIGDELSNIAIGQGAVWVTRATGGNPPTGEVVRIDPTTNEIVARIPVSGGWPRDLVVGQGSVWAYGHSRLLDHGWDASSLWRIDPVTNEAIVVVDQVGFLGDGAELPDNVAIGDGYVWVAAADQEGHGLRIDPATGEETRFTVEGGFAWPFMIEAGRVWFGRDEIRLLDTETLEAVDVVDAEIESIDTAFDPSTASLWVANYDGTITRIDLG